MLGEMEHADLVVDPVAAIRPFLGRGPASYYADDFAQEGFTAESLFSLSSSVSDLNDVNGAPGPETRRLRRPMFEY